jgi:anti-anti-sigma regulatory factor
MRQLEAQPTGTATVHQDEAAMRLSFRGELGPAAADALERELRWAEGFAPPVLVVDISEVTSVDVAALRALIGAANRAWCDGREVRAIAPPEPMWRLVGALQDQIRGLVVEAAPAPVPTS